MPSSATSARTPVNGTGDVPAAVTALGPLGIHAVVTSPATAWAWRTC